MYCSDRYGVDDSLLFFFLLLLIILCMPGMCGSCNSASDTSCGC